MVDVEDYPTEIQAIYGFLGSDDALGAKSKAEQLAGKGDKKLAAQAKEAMIYVEEYLQDFVQATKMAEEAMEAYKATGDKKHEGMVKLKLSELAMATDKSQDAWKLLEEATALFKELNDKAGQSAAMSTKIHLYIASKKSQEARDVAREAVKTAQATKDVKAEAEAQLLCAETCTATIQYEDAVSAAKAAVQLYKMAGDKKGQAAALLAVTSADSNLNGDLAVSAARERISLLAEIGEPEGPSMLNLANAHLARLAKNMAVCSIASSTDSLEALKAARDAWNLFMEVNDSVGQWNAMQTFSRVLMFNEVPPEVVEVAPNPEIILQDVLSGVYSTSKNALPPKPMRQNLKLDEVVPSSKQLERGKFSWTKPMEGFSYTLIWQPKKDRTGKSQGPRGSYDVMTLNATAKTMSTPAHFALRSNDAVEKNDDALVVYMVSPDASAQVGTTIMSVVNTLGAMMTARLSKLTFLNFNEGFHDPNEVSARRCNIFQAIHGILRSARLEAPNMTIGWVGGDLASWMMDPAPMIENVFDVVEGDECEIFHKKGEVYAPLLVHKEMEEPISLVKPKKSSSWFVK